MTDLGTGTVNFVLMHRNPRFLLFSLTFAQFRKCGAVLVGFESKGILFVTPQPRIPGNITIGWPVNRLRNTGSEVDTTLRLSLVLPLRIPTGQKNYPKFSYCYSTSILGYLTIFNLNFNSCRLPWSILVGIFFRKPETESAPSVSDECRIQNSDTSKIRWIPNCVNNRTSIVPL